MSKFKDFLKGLEFAPERMPDGSFADFMHLSPSLIDYISSKAEEYAPELLGECLEDNQYKPRTTINKQSVEYRAGYMAGYKAGRKVTA